MQVLDLLEKKKNHGALSPDELRFLIGRYTDGVVPDYQMAAFLMAVRLNGMNRDETFALTEILRDSGDSLDLSTVGGITADKHSTGGVADTTTLILAPLVACCGVSVAKISGRGLGHTGGTLDKLESVPGVNAQHDPARFVSLIKQLGFAIGGQSDRMVPADKKLYALRDVTATVDSIPLIASSIMSKKLALGTDALILDIKLGTGAFFQDETDATLLARTMVDIGKAAGKKTAALITDMNQPLGHFVGNSLELYEAIQALRGELDENEPLMQVTFALGEQLLLLAGVAPDRETARQKLRAALNSRQPLLRFGQFLYALGGDPECCAMPDVLLTARKLVPVRAQSTGYITHMNTANLGRAAMLLGAGRAKKEDAIDHAVGFEMHARLGDLVHQGEPIAELHVNSEENLDDALALFASSITIDTQPVQPPVLIHGLVE